MMHHMLFLCCIFRKSGAFSYSIFCESDQNKNALNKYIKIIDEIKDQTLFIIYDDIFVMGKSFFKI